MVHRFFFPLVLCAVAVAAYVFVDQIAETMFAGEKTMKQISSETELSLDTTQNCLCALLQHDLIMEVDGRGK